MPYLTIQSMTAMKKLTGKSYFDRNLPVADGTQRHIKKAEFIAFKDGDKNLIDRNIGINCLPMTTEKRRGRDSNPR